MTRSRHVRVEGYAIVSADGMIADHDRKMIDDLKIDADARFFIGTRSRRARRARAQFA